MKTFVTVMYWGSYKIENGNIYVGSSYEQAVKECLFEYPYNGKYCVIEEWEDGVKISYEIREKE